MRHSSEAKCREIITRVVEDFRVKYSDELNKKAGSVNQDFINRGLFNSAARVSGLLALHYEHASNLMEAIFKALEDNYSHLRPLVCQAQLIEVVEEEYASIRRRVPGWLQESSLLANPEMLASYEQGVTRKAEQAKKSIANACILWEERWKAKRRSALIKWGATVGVPGILLVIAGWFVTDWISGRGADHEAKPEKVLRDATVDPNTQRTPLFVRTRARAKERQDYLIKEKVHPWLFMWPESPVKVKLHDGRDYSYAGLEYAGSVVDVFWKSLDPFLEDAVHQVLDEVGKECQSNGIDPSAPLKEAGWLLESMVTQVYHEMADVNQKLRARGHSKSVPKVNVEWEIKRMTEKVQEHLKAAMALYSGPSGF